MKDSKQIKAINEQNKKLYDIIYTLENDEIEKINTSYKCYTNEESMQIFNKCRLTQYDKIKDLFPNFQNPELTAEVKKNNKKLPEMKAKEQEASTKKELIKSRNKSKDKFKKSNIDSNEDQKTKESFKLKSGQTLLKRHDDIITRIMIFSTLINFNLNGGLENKSENHLKQESENIIITPTKDQVKQLIKVCDFLKNDLMPKNETKPIESSKGRLK